MPFFKQISRSIAGTGRSRLVGAGIAAAGIGGFVSGVRSTAPPLSDTIYELATGNPDIDQEVFGQNMGIGELMFPVPQFAPAARNAALPFMAGAGGLLGFGIGRRLGMGGVLTGLAGAGLGAAATLSPEERRMARLMNNPTILSRWSAAKQNDYFNNKLPQIDGSIVFNQYNMRGG